MVGPGRTVVSKKALYLAKDNDRCAVSKPGDLSLTFIGYVGLAKLSIFL
jgi:hypothetical protein